MGAISNHNGDVANWIEKVIDSCETSLQEVSARKLIQLFERRLINQIQNNQIHSDLFAAFSSQLRNKLDFHETKPII